ncbi:MAG: phosphoglucosamine mutase, partial [Sorangiineae bacterium]|nr:phosphoglucosamine mutase [Sorangiineae bacterium]
AVRPDAERKHLRPELGEHGRGDPVGRPVRGVNINKGCGALHPDHMAKEVLRRRAHLGIALDGDADRVIIADERGEVVDGDALMALCARQLIVERRLAKKTVVATVMSNMGLEHALAELGGRLIRAAVGDRYVVEAMRRGGYNFGGEQSGHLIFLEHATTGDGMVAALQALAIMVAEEKPLSELARVMQRVPQVLTSVRLPDRRPIEAMPALTRHIKDVESKLGSSGRVLVRWSGTEPKLRLMVEGPDRALLEAIVGDLADAARRDLGGGA